MRSSTNLLGLIFSAIAILLTSCGTTDESASVDQSIFERGESELLMAQDDLVSFRHDIHQYPELSGQEKRTSEKIATELRRLGFEVKTNIGGYGVVGILRGPEGSPVIAFRADMDAVPDKTPDPVAYASKIPGVRHICGHDVHTAIGIGLAHAFAEIKDDLPGTIMLIFQPAEEAGTGARAMLADGVFSDLKPSKILAVHTFPMDVGQMAIGPNGMLAGRSLVTVEISGNGDIKTATSRVEQALKSVATIDEMARFAPRDPDFIDVDLFPAKTEPDSGQSVVRAFVMVAGLERRAKAESKIREELEALTFADVSIDVTFEQILEGVNNDPSVVIESSSAIGDLAPNITIVPWSTVIPAFSEDFGSFQQEVPGAMYWLGVNNPETGTVGFPHRPDYVADDGAILIGARAMFAASLSMMESD